MFSPEFFPTPLPVIEKLLEPYIRHSKGGYNERKYLKSNLTILEPSAGKGDICDYLKEVGGREISLYCCENDPDLKFILQGKGYAVIADDFLQYSGDYLFDLIVMNPPFSNADQHLLKAWEILEEGEIVCLINSETLHNPYSQRRKWLAALITMHGSVEHIGPVFTNAERKTSVSCSIVRLKKIATSKRLEFVFENLTKEEAPTLDETTFSDPIATRDVIGNMILQYKKVKELFVEMTKVREAMHFYDKGLLLDKNSVGITDRIFTLHSSSNKRYNAFNDELKQNIWQNIMRKTKVEKFMTHKVREDFNKFAKGQGCMDFTKENVSALISFVFENRTTIMESAIIEVFDRFTTYYKENRAYQEGWKTNDSWKVNKKIILPNWVTYNQDYVRKYGSDYFRLNYSYQSEYSDIDKVMCYLTGNDYDKCHTIYSALDKKFTALGNVGSGSFNGDCESQFFTMRFFKKGTLHLEFKDEFLWKEFNLRACAGKKWLPEAEMKKYHSRQYKETTQASSGQLMLEAA